MKRTLVVGASPNSDRYSYLAVTRLAQNGYDVIPLGVKKGFIGTYEIVTQRQFFENIHSITMYIGQDRQPDYYDYLLSLKPKRIIFNPGTENPEFMQMAEQQGIEVTTNCTLVMLSVGIY